MLRERLLKFVVNDLTMNKVFYEWSNFLRDTAAEIDYTGKESDVTDCVTIARPVLEVPRSRRQFTAAVLMLHISAAAEAITL